MKNKVLYSVLCCITIFTVLCSLFVVPSFAADEEINLTPTVVFYDNLCPASSNIDYSVTFISSGVTFCRFSISSSSVSYCLSSGSSLQGYASYMGGWIIPEFQTVTFVEPLDPDSEFYTWLKSNSVVVEEPDPSTFSWYQMLYDIVHTGIYGGSEMTSDQVYVCTLLSTILCVITFCVPFILVFWLVKYLFGWRL